MRIDLGGTHLYDCLIPLTHGVETDMNCSQCDASQPDGASFCSQCGATLSHELVPAEVCLACGRPLVPEAKFCNACGTAVGETAPGPARWGLAVQGDHYVLTVRGRHSLRLPKATTDRVVQAGAASVTAFVAKQLKARNSKPPPKE